MRFDLIDLRLFLFILETGSITHGAAQANMSLPSASARLRGMEEALGMPLLERGRRGVESTPAGDTLAHHARLVLSQIERMRGELGEHSDARKTRIRLWANTAAVTEFLPRPLAEFLRHNRNVHIDMKERQSTETVKAILNGSAEIGIVSDAVEHGALQTFPFATDKLVLIVARDHALSRRRRVALRDVVDHDFIGLSAGSALQEYLGEQALFEGRNFYFRARPDLRKHMLHGRARRGFGYRAGDGREAVQRDAGRTYGGVDRPLGHAPAPDLRTQPGGVATIGTCAG